MKSRLLYWICAVVITFLVTSPLLWSVRTSLAPARDASVVPSPTWENYRFLLSQELFYVYVKNSLIVSVATVIVVLIPAILSGYALARLNFPGRRFGILFLLVPLIPPIAVLVPLISYMYQFQLVNTLFGLIVLNAAFNLPFAVWMTRGFMLGVPVEVEEAGMIDGLSRFGALVRITVPLTAIGLFAVSAFVFIQTWNNYIYAYAIISSPDQRVLPMGILASLGAWGTQWGSLTAFGTLGVLPPLILLVIFQRWFVAGMLGKPE